MSACDILVIANLNMDLILEQKNSQQTSRKRYADSFTLSPGGNGYNEAVAAARMGATVALAGMIGSDSFGAQLKASLNEEITDSQLVRVVPGSSGLSLILSSAGQENIYWDIVGANACLDEEYIRGLESHIAKVKLLVVGFGVPYASTVLAIRLAQKHGTAVMLVAYQSRPLSDELLSMVDILVLDSREALPLADMEVTNLKSARIAAGMLLKRGVRQAVLLHMKSRFLLAATNGGFTSLEALLPERYDGEILLPFFLEGGRYTIDNVHYVREGDTLVPAGETEFARDTTFAYRASDLTEWCQEKTDGAYPAEQVVSISLDELRRCDYDAVCEKLMGVSGFNKVVVNAVCYDDVAVFVTAYLRAAARGKVFMFRGSAAVVKILGAVSDQPLLRREDLMCADQRNGGIIVVGSHVRKTTMQLETLQKGCPEIEYICFDVNTVFDDAALAAERRRILDRTNTLLADGTTVAVYTSRMVLRSEDDQREKNLAISVKISDALTSLVADLTVRPAFVLAKGGITSSDVGVKALRVHCARVRGQIAPGVPVWETGEESTFPHTPYIIFPGNVGTEGTLCQVVQPLLKK